MNTALSAKWGKLRGLKVVSIALGSVTLPDEDAEKFQTVSDIVNYVEAKA